EPVPEDVPDKERVRATGGLVGGTRPLTAIIDKYGLKLLTDVDDVSQSEKGWIDVKSKNGWVTGTIRYFQHIWPIGLTADSDGIDFKLFKEGDARNPKYATYPGEARTHEIWLAVSDKFPGKDAGQALADLAETPPRFDTSGLIRESYVWGEMPYVGDSDNTEIYTLLIEKVLDPYYRETLKGIRHFGGYTGGLNFYWNGLDSMYKLYAMTGERKWYDMAERSIRHYMDICTIHWSPDGSKVGGKNRSVDKFLAVYLVHQNTQPLFSHWNMTGDPEGYRLGRANADFIMNDKEMIMLTEQRADRQQGWPLMSMVRAWQETGDPAYEKHARRIVDIALGYMEQRRGAYLRVHGSTSHMGIVPFMSGILASGLRHYHLWSGDERAGIAVAQIAQSVNAEMHDPYYSRTKPDLDYYYSPNPYLKGRDGKTLITSLNHNIVSAQAYAAYITGDPGLADIAWRSWRAYVQNGQWGTRSYLYDLHAAVYWLAKAPVPERTLDVKVNSLWRYEAGAEEIWLQHKEKSPLKLRVRWTVYEQPYQRGQDVRNLKDYVKKRGLKGDLLLLNADGRVVSSVPLDFAAKPNGTVVDIEVPDALQGFYRLVSRGAEALPVQLILQDIVPRTAGWGLPLDRGYLNAGKEFFFHVPPGLNELDMMCDLIAPWEKSTVSVFDETGRKVEEVTFPGGKKFEWKVKLPAGSSGKLWRIVLEGSLNILLRIKDVNMVGLKEDAIFHISERPAPYMSATLDLPGGFTGKSVNVPAGEYLKVERGEKKEEYLYKNVNAKEGTIEFWMKVNADEESILHIPILSFGRMSLYHRGLVGAYYNLDKGFLQSGFIFRRGVWYHVALTWDLGSETRTPSMNLFVDGVSIMGRMQTPLPVGVGDWTGSELKIGSIVPVSISGLRIFSVSRNEKSKDVIIGEASGKDVLYRQ
ncbi:MAG TPA: hypothetical protein PKN36_07370, partial [bacterium]|nr:hypothetical protein [bacterium]